VTAAPVAVDAKADLVKTQSNTAGSLSLEENVDPEAGGDAAVLAPLTVVVADVGAGTGSSMHIATRVCKKRSIKVVIGLTVEPDEALLTGPRSRKDESYRLARYVPTVEELDANSDTITAIDIMKASLPCAANAIDLFNRHTGWPLIDSRSAGMIALAGLIARSRMGSVMIENTRGFVTSPTCILIHALVEAGGGGSFVWVGTGTHQRLPIFGVRAHLFVANTESKHLLAGIEAELRSGKPLPRVCLADILRGAGNSVPVEDGLELLLDQVEHGGSSDGPRRIGMLTKDRVFVAIVYGADYITDVAARPRCSRTSIGSMGAYRLDGRCIMFTRTGCCEGTGTELALIAHLTDGDAFRAIGGVAPTGLEERVWTAVTNSLAENAAAWQRSFALGPLMQNDPLAGVVQGHMSRFSGSRYLDVLHWNGQKVLAPFSGFMSLPLLRVCVIGQLPPLGHVQLNAVTTLSKLNAWLPVSSPRRFGSGLEVIAPPSSLVQMLEKACESCQIPPVLIASGDNLKSDSPPFDVVVWQALSAPQIHLPLVREILLNRCCAVFRIRLLSDAGSDELLESLYAMAVTAKFQVRCEDGDSAMHGDSVSAARSKLITLLYLPLFVAREFGFVKMGAPNRGTDFRGAQGDAQNTLISVATSIGAILEGLPDGSVSGTFELTGLPKSTVPSLLDRHHPQLHAAADGSVVLSINGTLPHANVLTELALNDDRVVLRSGESLLRRILRTEVLSALGFSAALSAALEATSLSDDVFQQLVWETEPFHSLSAQMLMVYSFALLMLADHARRIVMGQMQFDEVSRQTSTRGATASAAADVQVVPVRTSLPNPTTASVSAQMMVLECEGRMVSVPAGTVIKMDRKLSCRPRELLAQMKVDAALTERGGVAHLSTPALSVRSFFSGND
jgi:hypothetical protein